MEDIAKQIVVGVAENAAGAVKYGAAEFVIRHSISAAATTGSRTIPTTVTFIGKKIPRSGQRLKLYFG